jgi:glucose-fructose oxidoreductase
MTDPSNSELKTNFDQFGPELVYFSNCILQDIAPEPSGKEGLADVRIIQALLESQDKKRPMRIAAVEEIERPTEEQEIHRPPVGKPQLVKAAAPTKQG